MRPLKLVDHTVFLETIVDPFTVAMLACCQHVRFSLSLPIEVSGFITERLNRRRRYLLARPFQLTRSGPDFQRGVQLGPTGARIEIDRDEEGGSFNLAGEPDGLPRVNIRGRSIVSYLSNAITRVFLAFTFAPSRRATPAVVVVVVVAVVARAAALLSMHRQLGMGIA